MSIRQMMYILTWATIVGCVQTQSDWHFTGVNVALNKSTGQLPGTFTHLGTKYGSQLAVNGKTLDDGLCAHTTIAKHAPAYWMVYLAGPYIIKGIRIYNRELANNRLDNFQIVGYPQETILYDDSIAQPLLSRKLVIDVPVYSTIPFSNITITIPAHTGPPDNGHSILNLCEVEIYTVLNYCSFNKLNTDDNLQWDLRIGPGYISNTHKLVAPESAIDFACKPRYNLIGSNNTICLSNGSYGDNIPKCVEKKCDAPSYFVNGHYTQPLREEYAIDDTVTWNCSEGYKSDENRTRQCLLTSTWTGTDPICSVITCPFPADNTNVTLKFANDSDYISGNIRNKQSVTVQCDEGFKSNFTSMTCNLDGMWNDLPACLQVNCDRIGNFTGGNYTYMDKHGNTVNQGRPMYVFGTVVRAVCEDRFTYTGYKTCGPDGYWTNDENPCVALCSVPFIKNGIYEGTDIINVTLSKAGQYVSPRCDKGYSLEKPANLSDAMMTCLANHTWDGQLVNCTLAVSQTATADRQSPAALLVGAVAGSIVIVVVVGVVVVVVLHRRINSKRKPARQGIEHNNPLSFNDLKDGCSTAQGSIYEDCREGIPHEDGTDTYYNFNDARKMPERAIKVKDLAEGVLGQDSEADRFSKEFQSFPEGMTKPHQKALQNKTKNRYRDLYAYDDTRVILDVWDVDTDTDYFNACYIHGFKKTRAYIASQGPVLKTVGDFWRMVWQTKSGNIVMLTNLNEHGKMKCDQYWPETGTETYGRIKVTLQATDTFSSFVIRTLLAQKTGESPRRVKQFHFTSWPDKDVPSFCSSLVQFRNKVNASKRKTTGPLVVHCSTGVGRTGTYIAIDYLVDQGLELEYVDVAGCVETLRRQRVDMVKKEKQYVYVHQTLVEILVLETSVVPTSNFVKSYRQLLEPVNGKRKLDKEFELLRKLSPKSEKQEIDNSDATPVEKNRYLDILPAREFMPSLSQPGQNLYDEYINAAFLPMYRKDNAVIIAQAPLESTIEDFWKLVYHQQVQTIVMMNHVTQLQAKEVYWPAVNRSAAHEDITICTEGVEQKRSHSVVHLTATSTGQERPIQLIQFGKWVAGNLLPDDPRHMLSALELVEENQRKTGSHPIVVHCMDGVERSGLFCVIAATLDRAKIEQDVAISQVIQEIRNRRQNVIPNVEQFQFCHDVVLNFLQQYETYSNFAFSE